MVRCMPFIDCTAFKQKNIMFMKKTVALAEGRPFIKEMDIRIEMITLGQKS